MALISSKDKLIYDFSQLFDGLEKVFDSSLKIPTYSGHGLQVAGPPVALGSKPSANSEEQPKGFVQMFEDVEDLKTNEYAEIVMQYLPLAISVGKALLPFLEKGSPALFVVLRNVGIIGIGIAVFAELIVLKEIIEKDCLSSGAAAKELLMDTLEYTKARIQRNDRRFAEIEALIEKAKEEDFDGSSKKKSVLLIKLQEKIRVCKIDIDECTQKARELFQEIESTIAELNKKLKTSAWAAAGLGIVAIAGSVGAIVATGGLAIAVGVAAGATGVATGGLSFRAKKCGDYKHDFIVMKSKCDALLKDVRRMEERLKLHVKELQDCGINVGFSSADFK